MTIDADPNKEWAEQYRKHQEQQKVKKISMGCKAAANLFAGVSSNLYQYMTGLKNMEAWSKDIGTGSNFPATGSPETLQKLMDANTTFLGLSTASGLFADIFETVSTAKAPNAITLSILSNYGTGATTAASYTGIEQEIGSTPGTGSSVHTKISGHDASIQQNTQEIDNIKTAIAGAGQALPTTSIENSLTAINNKLGNTAALPSGQNDITTAINTISGELGKVPQGSDVENQLQSIKSALGNLIDAYNAGKPANEQVAKPQ